MHELFLVVPAPVIECDVQKTSGQNWERLTVQQQCEVLSLFLESNTLDELSGTYLTRDKMIVRSRLRAHDYRSFAAIEALWSSHAVGLLSKRAAFWVDLDTGIARGYDEEFLQKLS